MADLGLDAYRFSISWTRIYPEGTSNINWRGVNHYNSVIDALLDKDTCFREFGDRVKHWITLNEPHSLVAEAYGGLGLLAPGKRSLFKTSQTEPYIVGHHLLKAHASAVDIYRKNHKMKIEQQCSGLWILNWVGFCTP
ncbi:hypothetical protein KP509_01G014600 [Ceratopteris richardii]|uniref:Beta-glucosidase n=1 Tax=Ceratopteris richardii TaxID=49495 RepID=A0A8T2VIV1_CERRI|nr:hypothetical protein KP509_01G014600 [Ceratopteris richardii]